MVLGYQFLKKKVPPKIQYEKEEQAGETKIYFCEPWTLE